MDRRFGRLGFWGLVLLLGLTLAGCGSSASEGSDTTPDVKPDGAGDVPSDLTKPNGDQVGQDLDVADGFDLIDTWLDTCCLPDPGEDPGDDPNPDEPETGCASNAACGGQVCVAGACVACESGEQCDAPLGCDAETGLCGNCTLADQCPEGQACRNAGPDGECDACRVADECREGQACLADGACGSCGGEADWDCSGQLCTDGVCVPCAPGETTACEDDPAYGAGYFCGEDNGKGARCTVSCTDLFDCLIAGRLCGPTNTCEACDGSDACEEAGYELGTPCVEGVCLGSTCTNSVPRSCLNKGFVGRPICDLDDTCQPCALPSQIDAACGAALVVASAVCLPGGTCAPGDCHPAGSACGSSSEKICRADVGGFWCTACQSDPECVTAHDGLAHMICEAGACTEGCETKSNCSAGQVCSATHRCAACTANADCGEYPGAYLCVDKDGDGTKTCEDVACCTGSACAEAKACDDGRVCDATAFTCRDCTSHAECGDGATCDLGGANRCVTGACTTATETLRCPVSHLCDPATHACTTCDVDDDCGSGRVCDAGSCVAGECTKATQATACDGNPCVDHTCQECVLQGDPKAACVAAYGTDYMCAEGTCLVGDCTASTDCTGAKATWICAGHACTACLDLGADQASRDAACAAAYPAALPICEGSTCAAGCAPNTFNGLGQVCGPNHRFGDCAFDDECVAAYGDLNKICDPTVVGGQTVLRCLSGKTPGTACSASGKKVVGENHRCGDCATDGDCENSWGMQYICEPASATADLTDSGMVCLAGCTPGQKCSTGELCRDDKRCTPCLDVAEDSQCGYGYLCYEGACVLGTCRTDSQCSNGQVCSLTTHQCVPCSENFPCASGKVCASGQCLDGNCCVDANCAPQITCGNGQSCTNHRCEGCVLGSDCYTQHPCLDRSDACNADHTCKPVTDLDVLPGYCFIQGTCKDLGKPEPTINSCRICYWEEDGVTHDVVNGSKTDWTPGTWDTSAAGEWKRTHCYIDKRCVLKGTIEEGELGYSGVQSASCMQCDPRDRDADSLVTWSPRHDPTATPYEDWTTRTACDDPLYVVPDPANPGATKNARKPAYSGSPTNTGYCWAGTCWGMAWTPWLPLGMAGAGVVAPAAVTVSGTTYSFVGSFGGGFGGGIPGANPGCREANLAGRCDPINCPTSCGPCSLAGTPCP